MIPATTSDSSKVRWTRRLKTAPGRPVAFRREFKLVVEDCHFGELILDVLNSIENDALLVCSPEDECAFLPDYESTPADVVQNAGANPEVDGSRTPAHGTEVFGRRASIPVSIREWLPVACQWIGSCQLRDVEDGVLAFYCSNAREAIFPCGEPVCPLGPVAFSGYIALDLWACLKVENERGKDAVRFVIAHELVHAIDMLRVLVPAVQDWEAFWEKALDQGDRAEAAAWFKRAQALILDQYETHTEYQSVVAFWGKERTDVWWKAYTGKPPPLLDASKAQE